MAVANPTPHFDVIHHVKFSYNQSRWECVITSSVGLHIGSGNKPEDAVYDALEKLFADQAGKAKRK